MTREDILRMEREVIEERGGSRIDDNDDLIAYSIQLAALIAAVEREACARVCDRFAHRQMVAKECAAAIRARGKKP